MSAASYLKPSRWRGLAPALVLGLLLGACQTTPITGRRSLNLFSTQDDIQLGREAYSQVLAEAKLVKSGPQLEQVRRAMTKLSAMTGATEYEWEVSLIQDDAVVNAFALPGGKMAVYTGILPVCQSETGLAVVMGHEIGHVIARHGTERMTSSMGLEVALSFTNLGDYEGLARSGLDLLVNKPFGRSQESEADAMGLIYMARAGYDPREAVRFWERMEGLGGKKVPEFLSTHPSHETRVKQLQERLPEALEIWHKARGEAPGEEGRSP